ncbi:MAG: hypothetical protein ABI789_01270 [Usitatibacter sp.]
MMPDFTLYLMAPWWNARMRKMGRPVMRLPWARAVMYVVIAISERSNSRARTMRRKASINGSISTKSKAKPCGFTVPSFSASLLPCVRVTVFNSMRIRLLRTVRAIP